MKEFHINEHRVDDIWENRERQQQIIQSTISTEILPISTATSSENFNQIERKTLYPESTSPLNAEIKKRSSKSRHELRSRISDPISTNNSDVVISTLNETEKISSEELDALYEKEARRDEKNEANMIRLLATT
ncbi:7782_t:CDS:2 [Paraglomus occultum]|uniref:7782_t:CDS:1 n=1 Tax=Paraglomus occultum TaxID=144539 RepID=A0A9N9DG46_9GLOM|nr:7782_t:CDS:2 [Paraglomus occultum]